MYVFSFERGDWGSSFGSECLYKSKLYVYVLPYDDILQFTTPNKCTALDLGIF